MINPYMPNFDETPVSKSFFNFQYEAKQNNKIIVSILTPYYNTDKVFFETVDAVLQQSFLGWEWVIVDDGSNDQAAVRQLEAVANRDERIKIITQPNAGPSAARNTAFRNSCGKYICLLDSDDLLEPTYIEKCIWFLESQDEFSFVNSWSVTFGDYEYVWQTGFETGKKHITSNSGPPMSVIRRKAYEAVGGFNEEIRKGHEDWEFWLAMAEKGHWGYTIPEYLEWYRRRDNGRFSQIMNESSTNEEFEKYIHAKFAHLKDAFPEPKLKQPTGYEILNFEVPFSNVIEKGECDKRILFLIPWMVTGGADKVNLDWINGLVNNNCQVTICTTLHSNNNWYSEFAKLTPDIFVLTNFLHTAEYPRFLDYIISSRQIDVVMIASSTFGYHLLPYLKSLHPMVAFIDICHVEEEWLNGGHPRFGVGYQDLLDRNIVTTGHLRDWMIERGADGRKIEICYTGIDCEKIEAATSLRSKKRSQLKIPDDLTVIVYAGRLCDQKRPYLLAEILRDLKSKDIKFICLIVGDGELKHHLTTLLKEYKLESCTRMLGILDHQQWLEVLSASDIFLMPSEYEGISIALFESMAMKHVVPVMSDVGGQSEIIDKSTGFLITKDTEELQSYVETLVFLITNPSARNAAALRGHDRIRTLFTYDNTISQLLTIINAAIEDCHGTPKICMTNGTAEEMATFAVEYKRLSSLADGLWSQSITNNTTSIPGVDPYAPSTLIGAINLLSLVARTKLGNAIFTNTLLCKIGNRLFTFMWERQRRKPRR